MHFYKNECLIKLIHSNVIFKTFVNISIKLFALYTINTHDKINTFVLSVSSFFINFGMYSFLGAFSYLMEKF